MLSQRQTFWYVAGGILLLLAGFVFIFGIAFPYALPIMLIIAGGILIIAAAVGFRPVFPAFVIFLIGIIALGWAASAPYGLITYSRIETYELTTAQATVDEVSLTCKVSTGNIRLSFTDNATLLYRIVFTKHITVLFEPKVDFNYTASNEKLTINASSTTTSVDITLNRDLKSLLTLGTTTGNIKVGIPAEASKVEKITLATTTGQAKINMNSTAQLESLVATTATGPIEATIKSSFQTKSALVQLITATGRVKLDLNIASFESFINVTTATGRVNAQTLGGFTVLSQPPDFQASTLNYGDPRFKKLDVSIITSIGDIDISAQHA